ncbi:6,7-dimethyl-8-ribityllumazine synthase [Alloprevotella rava]|uniref:6,7-dimethyl-8-ribityllumazine synthase n=2 Tax=Alloprevotella rava TaxID=671218 RepID=G5G9N6_9BACT|nr:6,7-dimethyl-8-ribityllumazine synthase [Alloprevotella rava]EHG24086.1 6,7-dimethyl-8-ribityllumazine synthase [Alloprevotella rava F0323]MBB3703067.1 6,7-dimethyl-8-ribityllumazine synthase [Alloprevotella rava]
MSSSVFTLSDNNIPDASEMRFGIVCAEWNNNITFKLLEGALSTLKENGVQEQAIKVMHVPGSFELIHGCAELARHGWVDAIIAIGCVIKGDTPHFDNICQGVTQELAHQNTNGKIPVIYGLITVNTLEQAEERAGGKLGNKGEEFAITAIKMVDFDWQLQK